MPFISHAGYRHSPASLRYGQPHQRQTVISFARRRRPGRASDILTRRRRNRAAVKLMRKVFNKQGSAPLAVVTRNLSSCSSAFGSRGVSARREQGPRRNGGADNSHLPARPPDPNHQKLTSSRSAQPFLPGRAACCDVFSLRRHFNSRRDQGQFRSDAFRKWRDLRAAAARNGLGFGTNSLSCR